MKLEPRILEQRHLEGIARMVGRSLTADDLANVETLNDLASVQMECVRAISSESTPLAVMYVQEIAPSVVLSDAKRFVEAVVKARRAPG